MKKLFSFTAAIFLLGMAANAQTTETQRKTTEEKTTKKKAVKAVQSTKTKSVLRTIKQDARKEGQ